MKAVITDYQYDNVDQERALIAGAGFELEAFTSSDSNSLKKRTEDADVVITQYCEITADIIASMKHCRMIIKYGIGINNIDVDAASQKGIYVCNVPDYGVEEVSNHAIALLFALNKKLNILADALKAGDWGYSSVVPLHRLSGSTLGLVGFGRIPQLVAKKMLGFGVKIIAYDPFCPDEIMSSANVQKVELDELLKLSDTVSIHCPYTPDTHHMFNQDSFKKMKSSSLLINTARGPIVDEAALIEVLRNHEIGGAGLDVFEHEPLSPDSPLLHMQNVIATPHSAWYTEEAIRDLQRSVGEETVRVLRGMAPLHPCNMKQLKANGYC